MIGIRGMQRLDDRRLRRVIDLANEVLRALRRDGQQIEVPRAAVDEVAGAACGLDRGGEHRMHDSTAFYAHSPWFPDHQRSIGFAWCSSRRATPATSVPPRARCTRWVFRVSRWWRRGSFRIPMPKPSLRAE